MFAQGYRGAAVPFFNEATTEGGREMEIKRKGQRERDATRQDDACQEQEDDTGVCPAAEEDDEEGTRDVGMDSPEIDQPEPHMDSPEIEEPEPEPIDGDDLEEFLQEAAEAARMAAAQLMQRRAEWQRRVDILMQGPMPQHVQDIPAS